VKRADSRWSLLGLALTLSLASGCAGVQPVPEVFQQEVGDDGEFRIAPSDLLAIGVWKNPELGVEAPVLPDGYISVPLVGRVMADGLSTEDLEDLIAAELSEFITAPEVTVVVRQVNSKRASVLGGVLRNAPINLGIDTRILDSLAMAGGFTQFADRKRVQVIRSTAEGDVAFVFNYDAYIKGKAPGTNVRLAPGDVIVVPD
jgi:polysaccharide export outer membrane protein